MRAACMEPRAPVFSHRPPAPLLCKAAPRPHTGLGRGDMSTGDKVKAIIAGIVIGLMLAAPVAALVAIAGDNDPGFFHDLSPWSFARPR